MSRKIRLAALFLRRRVYLKAGRELPDDEYYEGYSQLEDGVGMIRSMQTEFDDELITSPTTT